MLHEIKAVLGASAVKDERNLVQVETKTFDGGDVKQPIVSLRLGQQDMCLLDISFGHTMSATFRLIEGTGPVCLSAQQLVEFPDEGQADISQDEGEEFYEDEEESPGKTSKGAKKRKAPTQAASKAKKGKISRKKASSEEDSEESEEDDLDDEDEDEDEDMDESEESSPEKNDKKSKKGKAEVTKAAKSSAKKSGKEPRGTPVSAKGKKKK